MCKPKRLFKSIVLFAVVVEKKSPPPGEDSYNGSHWRRPAGLRMESSNTVGSEGYADHVDIRCNDQGTHTSEPASVSSFVSVFDLRACDLHSLDRALPPRSDHLADTPANS